MVSIGRVPCFAVNLRAKAEMVALCWPKYPEYKQHIIQQHSLPLLMLQPWLLLSFLAMELGPNSFLLLLQVRLGGAKGMLVLWQPEIMGSAKVQVRNAASR